MLLPHAQLWNSASPLHQAFLPAISSLHHFFMIRQVTVLSNTPNRFFEVNIHKILHSPGMLSFSSVWSFFDKQSSKSVHWCYFSHFVYVRTLCTFSSLCQLLIVSGIPYNLIHIIYGSEGDFFFFFGKRASFIICIASKRELQTVVKSHLRCLIHTLSCLSVIVQ